MDWRDRHFYCHSFACAVRRPLDVAQENIRLPHGSAHRDAAEALGEALGDGYAAAKHAGSPRLATLYDTTRLRLLRQHVLQLPKLKSLDWIERLYIKGGRPEQKEALVSTFLLLPEGSRGSPEHRKGKASTASDTDVRYTLQVRDPRVARREEQAWRRGGGWGWGGVGVRAGARARGVRPRPWRVHGEDRAAPTQAEVKALGLEAHVAERPTLVVAVNVHLDAAGGNRFRASQMTAVAAHLRDLLPQFPTALLRRSVGLKNP